MNDKDTLGCTLINIDMNGMLKISLDRLILGFNTNSTDVFSVLF